MLKAFFSVLFSEMFSFSLNWLKKFFSDRRCICSQKTCILMKKSFLFSVTKVPIFWGKNLEKSFLHPRSMCIFCAKRRFLKKIKILGSGRILVGFLVASYYVITENTTFVRYSNVFTNKKYCFSNQKVIFCFEMEHKYCITAKFIDLAYFNQKMMDF